MINNKLKDKIAKIQELILKGATDGERAAANKALERIIKAHNIDESELYNVMFKKYQFKFSSKLELWLLTAVMKHFVPSAIKGSTQTHYKRVTSHLMYEEFITIDCAYEYFRRHMKGQYKSKLVPLLYKFRTPKTKRLFKTKYLPVFFSNYIIASGLYNQADIKTISTDNMSKAEYKKRLALDGIEGGHYNKQVDRNLMLEN